MKKLIMLLLFCLLFIGCTDPNTATEILTANGYKDIQMTGYNFFACSEDDFFHTGFEATTITGAKVKGTVCSGLFFKGSTIRF